MYTEKLCPCCGSENLSLLPAVVSPFLTSYVLGGKPTRCSLASCNDCTFRFFDSRLTQAEVSKLYSGYRGEDYFKSRHEAEPWYSRKVNAGIAADPEEIQTRNDAMADFLRPRIAIDKIRSVLDYGGDKGQFIPEELGDRKYVFELSDAQPIPGVTRIDSHADLNGRTFDLALLLGVLEHCSSPLSVLQEVRRLLNGSDSYLVIGVPYEWYKLDAVGTGALYNRFLDTLLKSNQLLKAVDFYSTVVRVRYYRIPPLGILKCHEHLNFFNETSIKALLGRAGMDVISCSTTQTCTYPVRTYSLNVLAKPIADYAVV